MKNEAEHNVAGLLEAHLDGRLGEDDRRTLEARLAADPAARAELAFQQRIDAALRRVAVPSDPSALLARVNAAQRAGRVLALQRQVRRMRIVRLAVAAVLVLAVGGGGWLGWSWWRGTTTPEERYYSDQLWRSLETVYRDEVKGGFKADWECKTEHEFARTFYMRFGQGLLLATLPDGIKSIGLSYCNSLSKKTTHLLATVNGQKVIVFVDRKPGPDAPEPSLSAESKLHLYKRELGRLVLYELSPLDHPYLLDVFYDPQKSTEWYRQPPSK